MTLRCPNCRYDFAADEILVEEIWRDEGTEEAVRNVVLQCPACGKALTPRSGTTATVERSMPD